MPDVKEAEPKDTADTTATGQVSSKAAAKSAKTRKPKARSAGAARAKADRPGKASVSAAAISAPAVSGSARRNYSEKEKTQKLGEIQNLVSAGETVKSATKKAGISEQTYYQWKKPAAKTARTDELKDLVKLEAENAHLKKLLADRLRKENAELKKKLGI